ncbi:MAG TPA: alanine dehydrogenase [Verrucomicrobiae bacterium]|nr:alanine dehydrogenase [Verrucomicrobiae bacterium]
MIIGVPKEIKNNEYRVGLLPVHCETLIGARHTVLVERTAGEGSGAFDADYRAAGARVVRSPREIYRRAEMIVKVKEPQPSEISWLRPRQIVFTYFHFAADRLLFNAIIRSGVVAISYETIQSPDGSLPLLTPMSEIAGRMAVHEGAKYLEEPMKGRGLLLAGVPGVAPAKVVILGGGVVGANAAKMAAGLGADVTILDINLNRLRYLDDVMPKNVKTLMSNAHNIREQVREADLLIGAVLRPGARAPTLVSRKLVGQMRRGAVIVDVAIDQGGCIASSRPTTHDRPTYLVGGVVHYCVTNMPGAVARTSTTALTNATFPYVLEIANKGFRRAAKENPAVAAGFNIVSGKVVYRDLATLYGVPHTNLNDALQRTG